MAAQDRDAQCPARGAGLSHVQDGSPECVFCGAWVVKRRQSARPQREHCVWSMCVERPDSPGADLCGQHRLLAAQHAASHELEGHSHAIEGCLLCG